MSTRFSFLELLWNRKFDSVWNACTIKRVSGYFLVKISYVTKISFSRNCLLQAFTNFFSPVQFGDLEPSWKGSGGVVVRAFRLNWSAIRFESLSTHRRWILSKFFISSCSGYSRVNKKKEKFGGKMVKKRANVGTDYCGLEQAPLKTTASNPPLLDHLGANMVP